jgi:Glycosyl transferase family 21
LVRITSSGVVVTFLCGKLLVLLSNLRSFPTLQPAARLDQSEPRVALLIPVRDEAASLPATLPGLLFSGAAEVIFLDDGSSDGSAQIISTALAEMPAAGTTSARLLTGSARPDGWTGKTWACDQLARATTADVLVFCDSDVLLRPGAVPSVVAAMRHQRADVFSVFCRQLVGGWPERLLLPLIVDVVLCFLPFRLLSQPVPAAATASGAVLAFRRDAYVQLGGFAAVRTEVVEDVSIARRTRRAGLTLGLALGGDVAQVRMYRGYRQVIAGMGRGLVPAAGGRRWLVALGLGWHLAAYAAPLAMALRGGSRWWRVAAGLGITERVLVEAKTGGRDWPAALLVTLSPLVAIPVVAQSLRPRQVWRGRAYTASGPIA